MIKINIKLFFLLNIMDEIDKNLINTIKNNIEWNLECINKDDYKYILHSENSGEYVEISKNNCDEKLIKKDVYNYLIYVNRPIKFILQTNSLDNIHKICETLCFNKFSILIMNDKKNKTFYVINPTKYYKNKAELDKYLCEIQKDIDAIEIVKNNYIPYIFNKGISIITLGNKKKKINKKLIFENYILNPKYIEETVREQNNIDMGLDLISLLYDEIICVSDGVNNYVKQVKYKILKNEEDNKIKKQKEKEKKKELKDKKSKKLEENIIEEYFIDKYDVDNVNMNTKIICNEIKCDVKIKKEKEELKNNMLNDVDNIILENIDKVEYINNIGLEGIDEDKDKIIRMEKFIEIMDDDDIILYKSDKDIIDKYNNVEIIDNMYICKILGFSDRNIVEKYYIYESISKITKLENIVKTPINNTKYGIYQYISMVRPIKLYFYLDDITYLEDVCDILKIEMDDIIIHKINLKHKSDKKSKNNKTTTKKCESVYNNKREEKNYMIIHKSKYFNNKKKLDMYYLKHRSPEYYINIELCEYIPLIYNSNINIISNESTEDNIKILEDYSKEEVLEMSMLNIKEELHKYNNEEIIYKKYVDYNDFRRDAEIIYIKSSMGSGKSTSLVNYINSVDDIEDKKILIISSRISLSNTIFQKFNDTSIKFTSYLNVKNYNELGNISKLIISPNSLVKLHDPLNVYDIIWIDEAASLISYMVLYPFFDIRSILDIMFNLILNTSQLILTDADIDDFIVEIYKSIKGTDNYQYLYYKNYNVVNDILYRPTYSIYNDIQEDIKSGKNLYVCSDSLRETKKIYNNLIENTDLKKEDILLYNSESSSGYDKNISKGVNEFWRRYRVVIVSPKIIYGVDFTEHHFYRVYGIYNGCSILSSREILQQLNRIRYIIDNKIIVNSKNMYCNLVGDIYTITYYLEKKYYNRVYLNKRGNLRSDFDNLLKMLKFKYINNYRMLDMTDPYSLMIVYRLAEKNCCFNNFKL